MVPERIELTSGLGVEGLAPVATAQAVQGPKCGRERRWKRKRAPGSPPDPACHESA